MVSKEGASACRARDELCLESDEEVSACKLFEFRVGGEFGDRSVGG